MIKKIVFGIFIALIALFAVDKVNAEETTTCNYLTATQNGIPFAHGKSMMFNVTAYGQPDYKKSLFYSQKMVESGARAFCIERANWNGKGKIYKVDHQQYQNIISKSTHRSPYDGQMFAARILSSQDVVDEVYNANRVLYSNAGLSKTRIDDMNVVLSQIFSWLWAQGYGFVLLENQAFPKVMMAQAVCGIFDYPDRVGARTNSDPCTFRIPEGKTMAPTWDVLGGLIELQTQEFKTSYANVSYKYEDRLNNEANFVLWVWLGTYPDGTSVTASANAWQNYRDKVNARDIILTVYEPMESKYDENGNYVGEYQALLSEYYCETEERDDSEGCWILDVDIPKLCQASGNSGKVLDTDDWECIFTSSGAGRTIQKHYNYDNSNEFCTIFCREEIRYQFPYSGVQTIQGGYLTVNNDSNPNLNNILPIKFEGKKFCRPTSPGKEAAINWESFRDKYDAANASVYSWWETSQELQAAQNGIAGTTIEIKDSNVCAVALIRDPEKVEEEKGNVTIEETEYEEIYKAYASENYDSENWEDMSDDDKSTAIDAEITSRAEANVPEDHCTKFKKQTEYTVPAGENGVYTWGSQFFVVIEGEYNTYNEYCGDIATKKAEADSEYTYWTGERERLVLAINACSSDKLNFEYDTFNPMLRITYEEEVYGTEEGWSLVEKGDGSSNPIVSKKFFQSGNSYAGDLRDVSGGSVETLYRDKYICGSTGSKCEFKRNGQPFLKSEWWESTIEYKLEYTLPDTVFKYIEKATGKSMHTKPNTLDTTYIEMPYGNLPVHYSSRPNEIVRGERDEWTIYSYVTTSSGTMENATTFSSEGLYDFKLIIDLFGNLNKFNKYIIPNQGREKFAEVNEYYLKYEDYKCEYMVKCNPMISSNPDCSGYPTTGDGIDLVYRTISLNSKKDAFPGINGTGRQPGSNWNDDTLINDYIVNNRGEYAYDIYLELNPLYEIELTPSIMRRFRTYNKKSNYDRRVAYSGTIKERVGILGYAGFDDFICQNGRKCTSQLLRGNVSGFEEIKVKGCAIRGGNTGYTCSASDEEW